MMNLKNGNYAKKIEEAKLTGIQFTEKAIFGHVFQIVGALKYLHSRGLVHRNLKPEYA